MSILNICDYKDEKENNYYKELQKCFGSRTHIDSVVFEKDKNPAELLMKLMTERYDLIVGHGFGGVLALYIGRATNVKTILINPAYPASRYWSDDLADYEYQELIEKITERDICWDTKRETTKNVYMILGRDDDVTDTTTSNKYLRSKNCFYVDGGHWPSGADFSSVFKKLVLGDSFEDLDEDQIAEKRRDEATYELFKDFAIGKTDYSLLYLYSYEEDALNRMSKVARRLTGNEADKELIGKMQYISADQLGKDASNIREQYNGISFLVIDHITSLLMEKGEKKALWIACNEVLDNNGRILLVSDDSAEDLFEGEREITDLIYNGCVAEFEDNPISINKAYKGVIDIEVGRKPYSDQYQAITIDEVDSKDGNIAIKWHSKHLKDQILYVYFENGKWHIDEKDGWANKERAAVILEKASTEFVKTVEITDHDGKNFFGWGW
ncbi:MAG: hypothetical protein J5717_02425 [Lachnospiraceae bacterium]|nr:hypothetical protein [Lachnospiraceae bacterium]